MAFNNQYPTIQYLMWYCEDREDPCGVIPMDVVDMLSLVEHFKMFCVSLVASGHDYELITPSEDGNGLCARAVSGQDLYSQRMYSQILARATKTDLVESSVYPQDLTMARFS